MKTLFSAIIILLFTACNHSEGKKILIDPAYVQKLNDIKKDYPFARWREGFNSGLTQYTEANCNEAKKIFDDLITDLVLAGEKADEKIKVEIFKKAILETNKLNSECDESLIETGEREDLCELTNKISNACGLDPKKFGSGEGLASEWRDW